MTHLCMATFTALVMAVFAAALCYGGGLFYVAIFVQQIWR